MKYYKYSSSFPHIESSARRYDDPLGRTVLFEPLFFEPDSTDDEVFVPKGILKEESTKWMIGKSHQNNCYNLHVNGGIYRCSDFSPSSRQSQVYNPEFQYRDGRYTRYFTDLISNPWDPIVSVDCMFNATAQGTPYFIRQLMVWYQIGPYWARFYPDSSSLDFPLTKRVITVEPTFHLASGGHPGKPGKSSSRLKIQYVMNTDGSNITIVSAPTSDQIRETLGTWSVSSYFGTHAKFELVPPLTRDGSYDVRFSSGRIYHMDEAFANSLDQVDFTTSNGLAFGLDAKDIMSQARSDLASLRAFAQGTPGKLKIAANLFLSFHYGWKLLASDAFEFSNALKEYSRTSSRRVHSSCQVDCTLPNRGGLTLVSGVAYQNVYYDPYAQLSSKYLKLAEAMDVVPDLSNVWDLIPFSFVVDWFTNIGELAEGIDAFYTLTQQHRVLGTIYSEKETYEYQVANLPGKYTYRFYDRTCRQDWYPIPEFSFQVKNPITNLTHWCEAGALVVATRP